MADVAVVVNSFRGRITAYLRSMEDLRANLTEIDSLGGSAFTNTFNFGGEGTSNYDMTEAEFNQAVRAAQDLVDVFLGGATAASAPRTRQLYRAKI